MSATGPEMLVNMLIKMFGLEQHVETLKQQAKRAAEENYLEQVKEAIAIVKGIDGRLANIEHALGIVAGPGADILDFQPRLDSVVTPQLGNGTDNG